MNTSIAKERALLEALGKNLRRPYRRAVALKSLTQRAGRAGTPSRSPIATAHDGNWWLEKQDDAG